MSAQTAAPPYTTSELMIAAGSRALKDGQVVFAGLGIPQLAVHLAQRTHAPRIQILNEIGINHGSLLLHKKRKRLSGHHVLESIRLDPTIGTLEDLLVVGCGKHLGDEVGSHVSACTKLVLEVHLKGYMPG